MTLSEAAAQAGVRVETLRNWIRRGWLPTGPLETVRYPDVLAASRRSVDLYGVVEPPTKRTYGHPQRGRGQSRPGSPD